MSLDAETKEYYGSLREQNQEKHERNRRYATILLDAENVKFVPKNHGAHIIIANRWDLWPGTGKWRDRKVNKYSHGLGNLIKLIKETK
jgi:hypothetical protein